jgi:branched-chain amino acid transport system permease protein
MLDPIRRAAGPGRTAGIPRAISHLTSAQARLPKLIGGAGWLLLAALVVMPFASGSRYIVYLGTLLAIWGSLVVSLNLVIGYAGQFSMSHAAFYGLGAYTSAILIKTAGFTFWASLPVAALVALVLAVAIGYPALRFTGGIHFALVTFAFGELLRLLAANWHELTNGPQGMLLNYSPEPVLGIEFASGRGIYFLSVLLLAATLGVVMGVMSSRLGRNLLAIREDEVLAASVGINVTRTKTVVYVISSILAALAGTVYAPFLRFISPEMMNAHESVTMVGMLIVGGVGTMGGPIAGMLIFLALPEVLRVAQNFRLVILGVVIVFVVLYMPAGIIGLAQRLLKRRFGRDQAEKN